MATQWISPRHSQTTRTWTKSVRDDKPWNYCFQSSVITDLFLIEIHFTIMLIIALLENQRQSILAWLENNSLLIYHGTHDWFNACLNDLLNAAIFLYPPWKKFRGVYRYNSVCPSVCLSVCLSSFVSGPYFFLWQWLTILSTWMDVMCRVHLWSWY